MDFKPTQKQRGNLAKLASHLESLPEDYAHFNINTYMDLGERHCERVPRQLDVNECGSCACAIGHGPIAGIRTYNDRTWYEYARRVFGTCEVSTDEGDYMFGTENENCHLAAAARIRKVLRRHLGRRRGLIAHLRPTGA